MYTYLWKLLTVIFAFPSLETWLLNTETTILNCLLCWPNKGDGEVGYCASKSNYSVKNNSTIIFSLNYSHFPHTILKSDS